MDVELLSRMVSELIVDHDQVGLPGVGTFVAEVVPATFSDRGYTINPPYRRLSFHPSRSEDGLLASLYATANDVPLETARLIVTQFLGELKAVLKDRKSITLPGLGRLRATRENNFFFIPNPDLDIFPDGYALKPVSLRNHLEAEEPVVIPITPLPLQATEPEPAAETAPVAAPAVEIEPVPVAEPAPELVEESEPEAAPETVVEPAEEAAQAVDPEPVVEKIAEPAVEVAETAAPAAVAPEKKKRFRWWIPLIVLVVLAVVALAVFMILASVAPDFIYSILYTPEELRIINY